MTEKIFKSFNRFLKENNIKKQFIQNYKKQTNDDNVYSYINIYTVSKERSTEIFCRAFSWGETFEGFKFWATMSMKWNSFINQIK